MRIVSLQPFATEIVAALGLEAELVGATHGCDWPPSIVGRPLVTREEPWMPGVAAPTVHDRIRRLESGGWARAVIDTDALAAADPDLVITQARCPVCPPAATDDADALRDALDRLGPDVDVVSLEPTSIEGILYAITTVGAMTELEDAAIGLVEGLRARLSAIEQGVVARRDAGVSAPRVVALEWLEPPSAVGHWVPEQIRRAGGWDLLGVDGAAARPTTWDAVAEVDPELLFLVVTGAHLAEAVAAWDAVERPVWLPDLPAARRGAVFAVDGAAFFGRAGPRVIDGIELLAEIMDPAAFPGAAPPGSWTPVAVG